MAGNNSATTSSPDHGIHAPPNAEAALAYMVGTPYGRICGTSDPNTVPPRHPVVALFNAQPAAIDERLRNHIASICDRPPNSDNVWGYDVLSLGPASLYHDGDGSQPRLPIRLIIKVKRDSSLGRDWATCTRLARTCYKALQDLGGISDVHCLVVEADLVLTQSNDPVPAPSFVPFKLDSGAWMSTALSRQSLLCMTNKIGQPIATLSNPTKQGTSGYFIRLSGPGSGYSSAGAQTFLLTSRHVVCDDDNTNDITYPLPSSSDRSPMKPIHVIQPGPRHLEALQDELKSEITKRNKFIAAVKARSDTMPDENDTANLLFARYKQELPTLESLSEHCLKHRTDDSQKIGTVAYSRSIGVRDEHRIDWALISCGPDASTGTGAYNNSCCISDIIHNVRDKVMEQVDPAFAVTVDGCANGLGSELEFITLNTCFSRSTVERYHAIPNVNSVPAAAAVEHEDGQGEDGKFLVYKYGATTGSTYGVLNSILSRHLDGRGMLHKDYCIVGPRKEFSRSGDSGSVVFGLLPILTPLLMPSPNSVRTPSPTINGSEGGNRSNKGHGSSQAAEEEATKPKIYCTPGIIGVVWGGNGPPLSGSYQDVTFATPFDIVLEDIEDFTGRKVIDLSRW
ncbi:hypothetical protein Daus18300_014477 [Diaporthe australafricana]|uniref:Uncharacterized protein n=1 Tax=Diaporthe australafricana TaxID=127596 RepID=A0ABR3VV25_9PEZI